MKTYTVQCAYMQGYSNTVDVEAETVEEACEKAREEASNDSCWRSYDDCGDTYVEAIGDNGEAWAPNSLASAIPVPVEHAEECIKLRHALELCKAHFDSYYDDAQTGIEDGTYDDQEFFDKLTADKELIEKILG